MILRKPYAFLIKYFKLIHLIITVLCGYVAFSTSNMLGYFNEYFNTSMGKADALQYINYWMIGAIVIAMVIVLVVIWLMKYKDKPRSIYYIFILVYLLVMILSFVAFRELESIFTFDATLQGIKAIRDLVTISLWVQYYFIACMLVRGLGFDIKKFNFSKDLQEFNIETVDSEEVEVTFGSDSDVLRRKGRRTFRELKYYYLENKFIINIILGVIIISLVGSFITDKTITNVVYNEGKMVTSGKYSIGVVSSYITNLSNSGKEILDGDSSLVIVKFAVNSNNEYKYKINSDYLVLEVGDSQVVATNKYNNYLTDIGNVYKKQYITQDIKYFILVYKVSNDSLKNDMKFLYLGNYEGARDIEFGLEPVKLAKDKVISTVNLNQELKFRGSLLNNSWLKISSFEMNDNYNYNYCYKDDCSYSATIYGAGNKVLKLGITSSIDESINIDKNWESIINNYMDVYYGIDNNTYKSVISYGKSPIGINDVLYIEVDKNIENASKIWLEFEIRNQIYRYMVKES